MHCLLFNLTIERASRCGRKRLNVQARQCGDAAHTIMAECVACATSAMSSTPQTFAIVIELRFRARSLNKRHQLLDS